ncbi:MAG: alginate lyase family protein, partial [Spirochaetia bacterium]|nr:alginate lyase family protein [Spirochaetia bacterium]
HTFVGQPIYPSVNRGEDIDWETNPTKDNEWIWQLHRMYWWTSLGKAYWSTGDEKYAAEWSAELIDWVKKNPRDGKHPLAWRTIETGQRGVNFTTHFEYFIDSPSFTTNTLIHLLKSVDDHGAHLMANQGGKNWLLFESEGLVFSGVYFPELRSAKAWREEGIKRFSAEIKNQVFPDGSHVELSISYHIGAIGTFYSAFRMAELNLMAGEFPKGYRETLENMVLAVMKWSLPDLTVPQFGDSWKGGPLTNFFRNWNEAFPRPELEYLGSDRNAGKPPTETAFALSNAGFYSLRNGWGADATCLVLKCGADGGFHCQPDNGTFELYALGKHFMPDSGSFIYSGDAEGRAWFRRTASHQTLTLGDANSAYAPKLILWQPGKDSDSFIVENASYEGLTHRRSVHFVRKKYFVLVDDAIGAAEGELRLHFQLLPSTAAFDEKNVSVRTDFPDTPNLLVRSVPQKGMRLVREEGQVSFVYTKKEARPAFAYALSKSSKSKRCRFVTVVLPYSGKEPDLQIAYPDIDKPAENAYSFIVSVNGETAAVAYDGLANKAEIK